MVGAVASAVATQVYRNILASSAEKLRALGGADETRAVASVSGRAIVEEVAASGTPIAPPEVREVAREREQQRIRRRVALLAGAAGVVAVLAYALVVNLATQGSGIGTKPQVIAPVAKEREEPPAASEPADTQPTEPDSDSGPGATTDDGDASQDDSAGNSSTPEQTDPSDDGSAPTTDPESPTDSGTNDTTGSSEGAGTDAAPPGSSDSSGTPPASDAGAPEGTTSGAQ